RAALARGPEVLALAADVVRDYGRRGLKNVLRGTIVLLQADDLGLGEILLELENVADVGTAPGVDRLVFVAHGADVVPIARQHSHEFVLGTIRVLIFV